MAITINKDDCIACGVCFSACPDVFVADDEGKADVADPASTADCVQEAIDSCPQTCIKR